MPEKRNVIIIKHFARLLRRAAMRKAWRASRNDHAFCLCFYSPSLYFHK